MLFQKNKYLLYCLILLMSACSSTKKRYDPVILKEPKLATEINQNLTYYCMLHESDGSFDSKSECRDHCKMVLHECHDSTGRVGDRGLLRCLKRRLQL